MEIKYQLVINIFYKVQMIDITEDDFNRLITDYSDYYEKTEKIDDLVCYRYKNDESHFMLIKKNKRRRG